METAGKEDMPEEAERKGLGTPATRATIIEKLVATGFVERKRAKKAVSLVPAHMPHITPQSAVNWTQTPTQAAWSLKS